MLRRRRQFLVLDTGLFVAATQPKLAGLLQSRIGGKRGRHQGEDEEGRAEVSHRWRP